MRIFLYLTLLFTGFAANAQDLTGIWRGSFQSADGISNLLNSDDRYKFEIQIDQRNKKFEGVTYSYKTTVFYGKAVANGTVNPQTGKVMLQELKLVEVKMQQSSFACVQTFFMQYSKNGNVETLEGKYTSFRQDDSSICDRGTVSLVRVVNSDFYKEPFLVRREAEKKQGRVATAPKIPSPKTTPSKPNATATAPPVVKKAMPPVQPEKQKTTPPLAAKKMEQPKSVPPARKDPPAPRISSKPLAEADVPEIRKNDTSVTTRTITRKLGTGAVPKVLTSRENTLIKTLVVSAPDVSLSIYDNGTIDHDTISVYLDHKLVVSRQMLTTTPIKFNFNFENDETEHELVMVAENLGEIPPNTSLMVVRSGKQEFEVRITSTEQRNAVVKFKYEKP
jgi:hypothetical protein